MPLKPKNVSLYLCKVIHMLIYASLGANFKEYLLVKNVFLNDILENVKPRLYNMQISPVERTSARSKHWLVPHWSTFKWALKQNVMKFMWGSLKWDSFLCLLCTTPGYNEKPNSINGRIAPCWKCRKTTFEISWDSACEHPHLVFWDKVIFLLLSPHPTPYPTSVSLACISCQPASVTLHYIGNPMLLMWLDITYQLIPQQER